MDAAGGIVTVQDYASYYQKELVFNLTCLFFPVLLSNAGVSRSTTVVIAFLMHHKQIPLQQAYIVVKDARPGTRPNDGFWKQLQQFEQVQQKTSDLFKRN